MKVLDLCCEQEHRFEGWFASIDAMQVQLAAGQLECPSCGSTHIQRLPSAPAIVGRAIKEHIGENAHHSQLNALIEQLREAAINSEDVGTQFASEARRIHIGTAPERSIRGQATLDDAHALLEEGIQILPLLPQKKSLH